MQNTKNVPLDLTGGWEDIVNNVERHNARNRWEQRKTAKQIAKLRQTVTNLSIGAVLAVALAWAKLLAPCLASAIAVVLACGASALTGRLWEKAH